MSIQGCMGIARICPVLICVFALTACVGLTPPPSPPPPTPDLEATVQAMVAAALATATPTPTADAEATVAAEVQAIAEDLATPTPMRTFIPDIAPLLIVTRTTISSLTPTSIPVPTSTRPSTITQLKTRNATATVEARVLAIESQTPTPLPGSIPTDRRTPTSTPKPTPIQPPASLVAWWPGNGNTIDMVGDNNGRLGNGATFGPGKVEKAFSFDGLDDFVALETQLGISTALTISAWVNFDGVDFGKFQTIFNNNQFFLRKDSRSEGNRLSIFVKLTDGTVEPRASSRTVPTSGTWNHVAGTWDGTQLRIYVNGILEGSSTRRGALTSRTVEARIGRGQQLGTEGNPFSGLIDEVEIFDRALSADVIKAIYNTGSAGIQSFALTPKQGPISECGEPTIFLVDTLGEIDPGDELSGYPSYYIVNFESYLGPSFTLTEETIITEIGAFLDKPNSTRPFRIEIVRSSAGKPDRSDVIRRIRGLSDDEYYGKYSYESVELDLTLSEGTYFALFTDPSERGGTLLRYTRKTRFPYAVVYRPESSFLGTVDPQTGTATSFTDSIAVRILGRPASSAVTPITSFEQVKTAANDVAISPSQGLIASAFSDGWARTWEIPNRKKGGFFDHGNKAVTTLAFSPDGALLITGSSDGKLTLWDAEIRKRQLFRLDAHTDSVTSVSYSPDGERVATSSEDGWVRLWNVDTTEELSADTSREVRFEQAANTVSFSPNVDNPIMAMVIGKRVELWRYDTWERFLVIEERSPVNSLSFRSDGSEILVGLESGAVSLWELEDGKRLRSFQLEKPVTDMAISPNDALLAVGSEDNAVHLWNINTWFAICDIVGHERDVNSVAFSPDDNSILASGSRDGTVRIWNIDDDIVKDARD